MPKDYLSLPEDLPVPVDDGACDHLPGMKLAPVELPSTSDARVDPSTLRGRTVLYCYPRTGVPGEPSPAGWDEIPGARGCTPESCAFRDYHAELAGLGTKVFGLSTQDTDYQREAKERLNLPYDLLSDEELEFAGSIHLPTFEFEGMTLLKRVTLMIRSGEVEGVFYPVFPPDENAREVVEWLSTKSRD